LGHFLALQKLAMQLGRLLLQLLKRSETIAGQLQDRRQSGRR
jgi:hypothetical protein